MDINNDNELKRMVTQLHDAQMFIDEAKYKITDYLVKNGMTSYFSVNWRAVINHFQDKS